MRGGFLASSSFFKPHTFSEAASVSGIRQDTISQTYRVFCICFNQTLTCWNNSMQRTQQSMFSNFYFTW
jgi:hypothetical protein